LAVRRPVHLFWTTAKNCWDASALGS
jgi:hypothetical protein